MVPEGLPRDRGKLLYEATDTSSHSIGSIHDVVPSDDGDDLEPTIEERARAKQERIQSLVGVMRTFFVLALVMTILPVMFIWYNDAVSEFWPMLLLIFMMIVIVFGIIMWISHMSKHPYRERIFENGFSAKDGFGGEIFVPWGIVRAYKEYDMEPDGEVLDEIAFDASKWDANKTGVMLYGNGKLTKLINSDVDNYPRIIGLIRTKVGHGEYETPSWEDTSRSTFLRASVMILAFSLFAGFLFALLVYFFDRRLVGDGTQALILTTLVISLIAFPITQYIITGWFWGLPKGIYPYVITLAMSSILIVSAIGFSTINDFSTYGIEPYIIPSDDVGPSGLSMGVHDNLSLIVEAPIIVGPDQVLILRNCNLEFRMGWGDDGILVHPQGRLEMYGTRLSSLDDSGSGLEIEISGYAWIENCTFDDMDSYYSPSGVLAEVWFDGGLEIKSSSVHIIGSTFSSTEEHAIIVNKCQPIIEDCYFFYNGRGGLFCYDGEPSIVGCTFEGGLLGLEMWDSGGMVKNCTFLETDDGVVLIRSTTEVDGCDFSGVRKRGIAHDPFSQLTIGDNEFGDLSKGVVEENRWPTSTQPMVLQMAGSCAPLVLIISLVGIILVFRKIRWLQVTGGRPAKRYIDTEVMKGPNVDKWTKK